MEKIKECTKCGVEKPYSAFYPDSRATDGLRSACRTCVLDDTRNRNLGDPEKRKQIVKSSYLRRKADNFLTVDGWARRSYLRIGRRARAKGVPFQMTPEDIIAAWPSDGLCPILGVPLNISSDEFLNPSVDRLIPDKGYVTGNIAVIATRANTIKNSGSVEEHQRIVDWMTQKLRTSFEPFTWVP